MIALGMRRGADVEIAAGAAAGRFAAPAPADRVARALSGRIVLVGARARLERRRADLGLARRRLPLGPGVRRGPAARGDDADPAARGGPRPARPHQCDPAGRGGPAARRRSTSSPARRTKSCATATRSAAPRWRGSMRSSTRRRGEADRHHRRGHGRGEPRRGACRAAAIVLIEAESHPAYHATGRSAAFWSESYGGPLIQPLTSASRPALARFLSPRGAIHCRQGGRGRAAALAAAFPGVALAPLDRGALEAAIPACAPAGTAAWPSRPAPTSTSPASTPVPRPDTAAGATLMTDAGLAASRDGRAGGSNQRRPARGRNSGQRRGRLGGRGRGAGGPGAARHPAATGARWSSCASIRRRRRAAAGDRRRRPLLLQARGRRPAMAQPARRDAVAPCDCAPEEIDVALAIDRLRGGGRLAGRRGRAQMGGPAQLRAGPAAGLRLRARKATASSGSRGRAASASRRRRRRRRWPRR